MTSGGLLWIRQWGLQFHKLLVNSLVASQLRGISKEMKIYSTELSDGNELEKAVPNLKFYPGIFLEWLIKTAKVSVRSACVPAEIRKGHLWSIWCEVLTAAVMNCSVSGDKMPHTPLDVNWRSGGTCCLQLQGRRMSQTRNTACYLLNAGFLFSLFVDPVDGDYFSV